MPKFLIDFFARLLRNNGCKVFTNESQYEEAWSDRLSQVKVGGYSMLTQTRASKLMEGDYIPSGELVDAEGLKFWTTREYEVYRCCRATGEDLQSGPHYCGRLADFLTLVGENQVIALCKRHSGSGPKNLRATRRDWLDR